MVVLESFVDAAELRELAAYLSEIGRCSFDVVVLDGTPWIEQNCRVLRWVSRYVVARPRHCNASGIIDPILAADAAACDKVVVCDPHVRYDEATLGALCALLDLHEIVEPETYFDPLPWWGGIEAARLLVRRGVGPLHEHSTTFAFRKTSLIGFRGTVGRGDCLCRLSSSGADVFPSGLFVRRIPPPFCDWVRDWPSRAGSDLGTPLRAVFFCMLLPLGWFLSVAGGPPVIAGFVAAIICGSMAMAIRGRIGAGSYFPLRACLFAPLAIVERSFSIYWALLWRALGARNTSRVTVPVRSNDEKVGTLGR